MATLQDFYTSIDSEDFLALDKEHILVELAAVEPEDPDRPIIQKERDLIVQYKDIYKRDEINKYSKEHFEYCEERYDACNGLLPKIEYGLFLYYGQKTVKSQNNAFKKELAGNLETLALQYLEKANNNTEDRKSAYEYSRVGHKILEIYNNSRMIDEFNIFITLYSQQVLDADLEKKSNEILLFQIAGVLVEYYKQAKDVIDYNALCDKLYLSIDLCKENNPYYAENLIDLSLKIKAKQNVNAGNLSSLKANTTERIANTRQDNIGAISSLKKAIILYKNLGHTEKVNQLSQIYSEKRNDLGFSIEETEYPSTKKINNSPLTEKIKKTTSEDVLNNIVNAQWLTTLAEITEYSNSIPRVFGDFPVPIGIYDNIGNLVSFYKTKEEIENYYFWDSYDVHANINISSLSDYILKAHELNKISYSVLIKYLETTWYNDVFERTLHGRKIEVRIIDLLKPCLQRLFIELCIASKVSNYKFDYVTVLDSFVLKIEMIIRYFCEKKRISTFKIKPNTDPEIVLEKLLDELIANLEDKPGNVTGFVEEDRQLIKYALTLDGLNLRNKIAHGLMFYQEYRWYHILLVFYIILRLSRYTF